MKDRKKRKDHLSNGQYTYLHQAGHKDRAMTKKKKRKKRARSCDR